MKRTVLSILKAHLWSYYRLENDPRFQQRVAEARASCSAGKGIPWEDIEEEDDRRGDSS